MPAICYCFPRRLQIIKKTPRNIDAFIIKAFSTIPNKKEKNSPLFSLYKP